MTEEKIKIVIPRPHSLLQANFVYCETLRQIVKSGRRWGKTFGAAIKALVAFLGLCPRCGLIDALNYIEWHLNNPLAPQSEYVPIPPDKKCKLCKGTGNVPKKRVLYAAPTDEQVGKFWYEITSCLLPAINAGVLRKDETRKFIEVPETEYRIKAKTAWNPNTLRGDYADLLILEEYQLMSEDTWTDVGAPMMLDRNGTAVFIFTPPSLRMEGTSHARDPRHASKLFNRHSSDDEKRWMAFHSTSLENPILDKTALSEITEDMTVDSYRREILAEDDEIEDTWLVHSKFNAEVCRIPRFDIPKSWYVFSGHDFGSANPAALFLAEARSPIPESAPKHMRPGDLIVFAEYVPGPGFSISQHVLNFKDITAGYKVLRSVGGNITTEAEIRDGYTMAGWPISAPALSKVNAQIERVVHLEEDNKLYIFQDLVGLYEEIANCMWKLTPDNRPTNDIADEKRYHRLACLRYIGSEFRATTKYVEQEVPAVSYI